MQGHGPHQDRRHAMCATQGHGLRQDRHRAVTVAPDLTLEAMQDRARSAMQGHGLTLARRAATRATVEHGR